MITTCKRISLAVVMGCMALPAYAAETQYQTEYKVALSGLPIARAVFSTRIGNNRNYQVTGNISSAGLGDLLASISAKINVAGTMGKKRLQASKYVLYYKSGKRARTYDVRFRGGNIVSATTTPEPRRPENWIPVAPRDMRAVLDPISGLIFPEGSKVCPQTLPIFDGETRMDLVLSPKGKQKFTANGFSGDVLTCSVRFVPRSGYRKGRKDIDYLSKSDKMEIWFAKGETNGLYAPVFVRIPTQYGAVTITAVKYGS